MRWLFILCMMASFTSSQASWDMAQPQGFLWYNETPPLPEKYDVTPENAPPSNPSTTPFTDKMKAYQEAFEESKTRAILKPTYENVRDFKTFQDNSMDRSTDFGKMWMWVNLSEGGLREEDNGNNAFRKMYAQKEEKALEADIHALSKSHGLFFFFKSGCVYCHRLAPLVKGFAQVYGFDVKAVSKEGSTLPQFPHAVPDNGMGKVLNPEGIYPALFLANPSSGEVLPIAWGYVSEEQLKMNIKIVMDALRRSQ